LFFLLATFFLGLWAALLIVITSIPFGLRYPVIDHMLNLEDLHIQQKLSFVLGF